MKEEYIEIKNAVTEETVIERSRFICRLEYAATEIAAREFIAAVKREHPFATHNCYAYVTENGEVARFSDDGEPQGTAGQPMLEVIKNKGIVNVVAVVTRYFGGVKLGAGGLVRAYSGAVNSAARAAGVKTLKFSDTYSVRLAYDAYQTFLKFAQKNSIIVLSTDFADNVVVTVAIKKTSDGLLTSLVDALNGRVVADKVGEGYYAYE